LDRQLIQEGTQPERSAASFGPNPDPETEGKWSAQENAGHLLDLEPLWLARVRDYAAASAQLTVADLTNRQTDEADLPWQRVFRIRIDVRRVQMQKFEMFNP
jgi:hypothetical protein